MAKLYSYGFRGIPHKLMKSYLINRTQQAKFTHVANSNRKNICQEAFQLGMEVTVCNSLIGFLFVNILLMMIILIEICLDFKA
jgi:hypothetical protein